jgi:hypothetical protein
VAGGFRRAPAPRAARVGKSNVRRHDRAS